MVSLLWGKPAGETAASPTAASIPEQTKKSRLRLASLLDSTAVADVCTALASPSSSSTAPTPSSRDPATSAATVPPARSSDRCWFLISEAEEHEDATHQVSDGGSADCLESSSGVEAENLSPQPMHQQVQQQARQKELQHKPRSVPKQCHMAAAHEPVAAEPRRKSAHSSASQDKAVQNVRRVAAATADVQQAHEATPDGCTIIDHLRSRLLTCTRLLRELQAENNSLSESLGREQAHRCAAVAEANALRHDCEALRGENESFRQKIDFLRRDAAAMAEQHARERERGEAELLRAHTALVAIVPELEQKVEAQRQAAASAEAALADAQAEIDAYQCNFQDLEQWKFGPAGLRAVHGVPEKLAAKFAAAFGNGGRQSNADADLRNTMGDGRRDMSTKPPAAG